jgi:hypothetical protein
MMTLPATATSINAVYKTYYTLDDFMNIKMNGFEYKLPDDTLSIINDIAKEVGSPFYIKTPVFKKNENYVNKPTQFNMSKNRERAERGGQGHHSNTGSSLGGKGQQQQQQPGSWGAFRSTFQATKLEQKTGIDADIDQIRSILNKITDKNYIDMRNKITTFIDKIVEEGATQEDMKKIGTTIFDIASTNIFYSKMYADLYSDLIDKYGDLMNDVFQSSFNSFLEMFEKIEYVESSVDYDKFCKINKENQKKRSLCSFFVNLMKNGMIGRERVVDLLKKLVGMVGAYILEENRKNEVDELTENIALLCFDGWKTETYVLDKVTEFSKCTAKTHKSLSSKSIFKYMDILEK